MLKCGIAVISLSNRNAVQPIVYFLPSPKQLHNLA